MMIHGTIDVFLLVTLFLLTINSPTVSMSKSSKKSRSEQFEVILPIEVRTGNKSFFFTPSSSKKKGIKLKPIEIDTYQDRSESIRNDQKVSERINGQSIKRKEDIYKYKSSFQLIKTDGIKSEGIKSEGIKSEGTKSKGIKSKGIKTSSSYRRPFWPQVVTEPIDLEPTIRSKEIVWPEEARKLRRYEYFEEREDDDRPADRMRRMEKRMKKARRKVYKIEPVHIDDESDHHPDDDDGRRMQKGSDRRKLYKKKVQKLYPNKLKRGRKKSPSKRRKLFVVG